MRAADAVRIRNFEIALSTNLISAEAINQSHRNPEIRPDAGAAKIRQYRVRRNPERQSRRTIQVY
jgi:hypothetical protein